ncbi:MAG: prolyl oligopeptidase family serine peptidase [Bacteroidota bacterium]
MRKISTLILLFSTSTFLCAQHQLQIKLIDQQSAAPLAYANVYLKNNKIGNSTDLDGLLQLNLKKGSVPMDTLVCSYVGYRDTSIIVDLRVNQELTIALQSNVVALNEVLVQATAADLNVKKILRKSLKNVKKNYSQQPNILSGFYRELVKEDERYIQLNEAFFELYYTSYPQKRYARKGWNAYYETYATADHYPSDKRVIFTKAQYQKYWNTIKDQCKVISARASEDWSEDDVEIVPENGPLDLTAIDKVKYQSDFLDLKLTNKYVYSKIGAAYINDEPCYIISFKPKKLKFTQSQDQGKKVKIPIYSGKLYISMNDFAVARFECQLTEGALPPTRYRRVIPATIALSCDYQKEENQWFLKEITSEQILNKKTYFKIKKPKMLKRTLSIQQIKKDDIAPFPYDFETTFIDRRVGNLRYFPVQYDSVFWKNPEDYLPLPNKVKKDLGKGKPLEQQFKERFFQANLTYPDYFTKADTLVLHKDTLVDNYAWLNALESEEVQDLIKAENKYFKNYFVPMKREFAKANFALTVNTKSCEPPKERPLPAFRKDFNEQGKFGLIYEKAEQRQLLFDHDLLCEGCQVDFYAPNPDTTLFAYVIQQKEGKELYIKNIQKDSIVAQVSGFHQVNWLSPDQLIYQKQDQSRRDYAVDVYSVPMKLNRIQMSTLHKDQEMELIYVARDKKHWFYTTNRGDFNDLFVVNPKPQSRTLLTYEKELYTLEVKEDDTHWYALVRDKNWKTSIIRTLKGEREWETLLSYNKELLDDFSVTPNFIVTQSIENAVPHFYIHPKNKLQQRKSVKFPSKFYDSQFIDSAFIGKDSTRLYYSAWNELQGTYDIDLKSGNKTYKPLLCYNKYAVEETPIYKTELLQIPTTDGQDQIPLRLSKNADPAVKTKGIILKVYGAYGAFSPSGYNKFEAFLMNQGYLIAQAHIRGTRAKGWEWYAAGKVKKKQQGIEDYLACTKYLIEQDKIHTNKIVAYGQSAGGLIVGAAINKMPELFRAAILDYPYLDVITTMSNDSLPLTSLEYQEWGNPADEKTYQYIKEYSPYQNIKSQPYPALLFLTGTKDFQTPYWQVTNSVAKYRKQTSSDKDILVQISDNGHVGTYPTSVRTKELIYQYLFMERQLTQE